MGFAPQFGADGLITAVVTDAKSGDVLMVAHMNAEALAQDHRQRRGLVLQPLAQEALEEGRDAPATSSAWSNCASIATRTRSGSRSSRTGAGACHTGRRSCFYRAVPLGQGRAVTLEFRNADKTFDPHAVYGGAPAKPRR